MSVIEIIIFLIFIVISYFFGKRIGWAIRAWPGHEKFHCDYLKCPSCEGGLKIGCYNAGSTQDKIYLFFSLSSMIISLFLFGISIKTVLSYIFLIAALVITVIDYRYYIIPDLVSIGGYVSGLLYNGIIDILIINNLINKPQSFYLSFSESLLGFFCGYGLLAVLSIVSYVILKKEGMGWGDVKLLGAMGAWLGWKSVIAIIIVSSFLGSIVGISNIIYKRVFLKEKYKPLSHTIPFGPFLAIGFLLVFYFGLEPFLKILSFYQLWLEKIFIHNYITYDLYQ